VSQLQAVSRVRCHPSRAPDVELDEHRVGMAALDAAKASERDRVLSAEHDRKTRSGSGFFHRRCNRLDCLLDARPFEVEIADIDEHEILQVAVERGAVRLEGIGETAHGSRAGAHAGTEATGCVERRAEERGGSLQVRFPRGEREAV